MSGIRSITRRPTVNGYATAGSAPIYVDSDDNTLKYIPAGSGTTEVAIPTAISTSGAKFAAGSGVLVTGSATIQTGLTSVLSFTPTLNGATGFATGATEVSSLFVASITTGSVVVKGLFYTATGAATISASGTSGFLWTATGM